MTSRQQLGIQWCPVCAQDTIPSDGGYCYWCRTRISDGAKATPIGKKIHYPPTRKSSARPTTHGEELHYRRGCKCDACRQAAATARKKRRTDPWKKRGKQGAGTPPGPLNREARRPT